MRFRTFKNCLCTASDRKHHSYSSLIVIVRFSVFGKFNFQELYFIGVLLMLFVINVLSNPRMIQIFIKWLTECCGVSWKDLKFRIYIHESADALEARSYWKSVVGRNVIFSKTAFKRHNPKTNRRNRFTNYHGLLDITVRRSTDFNRKITGWINGIINGA